MDIKNFNLKQKKVYVAASILTIFTFLSTSFLDSPQLRGLVTLIAFLVYVQIGLFFLKRNKLILQIHNGIFDKDIRCYLYQGNKKIDFFKIRAYENIDLSDFKEQIELFLKKNSNILKQYTDLNLLGFSDEEQYFIKEFISSDREKKEN